VALEQPKLREFSSRSLSTLDLAEPTLVSPTEPLNRVIASMRERGDSCALVAQDGVVRGIVTERDVLCRFMDDSMDWEQPVEQVMTPEPLTLDGDAPIISAIRLMREHDFRTVPIMEGGSVRGLVRLGDLIRNLAELFPEEILNLPPRPNQQMKSPEGA
jgi:CBS domain-containing protein